MKKIALAITAALLVSSAAHAQEGAFGTGMSAAAGAGVAAGVIVLGAVVIDNSSSSTTTNN